VVRLGQTDLEDVVRFVGEAATVDGPDPFPREVLVGLRRLVPCDSASYCELDRVREELFGGEEDPDIDGAAELVDVYWRLRHEHPVGHHQDATGDFRALKLSDFVTPHELRRREIYSEWFRPWGVEHEMSVGLDAPIWHTKVFFFGRGGRRDFDERDRAVLELLRPHLARLYRAAQDRRRARDSLELLGRNERGVVLLDEAGRIESRTPEARRLLDRYFGAIGARLPDDVVGWRRRALPGEPLTVRRADASLVLHSVGSALLLEERRDSRLTAREREVLDLVAEGKTNAEIAAALWISPGTVRRHLDNVFRKLGVHTRTAAVACVGGLRRMG
jgi:DNA-binding CsgD family transcriptional regulator